MNFATLGCLAGKFSNRFFFEYLELCSASTVYGAEIEIAHNFLRSKKEVFKEFCDTLYFFSDLIGFLVAYGASQN